MIFSTVRITTCERKKWLILSHWLEFPDALIKKDWYCDIFTYTYTNIDIYAILILEVPDSMAAAPQLDQFMLEFDLGRLCGMTLYEILSLAIDLAILILTALSYLKDRKS